jgi:hypothetical protein
VLNANPKFAVQCQSALWFDCSPTNGRCWREADILSTTHLRFIAAGFEHCIANMYFLPLAWLLVETGHVPAGFDGSSITLAGVVHNLVPVTLGSVVGGAGIWAVYRVALGAAHFWPPRRLRADCIHRRLFRPRLCNFESISALTPFAVAFCPPH